MRIWPHVLGLVVAASSLGACGKAGGGGVGPTGLESLMLSGVDPNVVVPGTRMIIEGSSFLDGPLGVSWLRLAGTYGGTPVDTELPAQFVDFDELEIILTPQIIALLGANEGLFDGSAAVIVDFTPDGTRHTSNLLPLQLDIQTELEPVLDEVASGGAIFVNDEIIFEGSGILLDENEGTTFAVVSGCFTPEAGGECQDTGTVEVPVTATEPFNRNDGSFPFSPAIAGIFPGSFEGTVKLRNEHVDGGSIDSEELPIAFDMIPTEISTVGPGGSLGQFIDIEGGGFVGGGPGQLTILRLEGEYVPDEAVGGAPVMGLELIPEYVGGRLVKYVVSEDDPLGMAIDLREDIGTFDGTIQAVVRYEDDELVGPPTPISFRIEPVKQVVWVNFQPSFVESLRTFGLRAVDARIRERILAVMVRDYETINVEFRTEEPEDFKLFAIIDIAGPDPNGLGLLGYDNTPGKDKNNERLFDRIGGVNALTQEDGFPGFGGVFIESLFTFSEHPPQGGASEVATPIFDDIFDEFRSDRGGDPISAADFTGGGIPELTSGGSCPADDRRLRAACAVWVLGSVVGSTTSHELGHSLGLADPKGMRFHNLGDGERRLMDKGGNRPFEERAELEGMGPSSYCSAAYDYLREVLGTSEPETDFVRPPC